MLVEMAVKSMETAVEAMASMEMAPGHFPILARCRNRDLYPKNLSSTAAALRNFTGENANFFRVYHRMALYRRRGRVRGGLGPPHPTAARARGRTTLGCGCPLAPLRLPFSPRPLSGKNRSFGLCFVQFREYFLCSFSETQK
jgi:hypothetical protein